MSAIWRGPGANTASDDHFVARSDYHLSSTNILTGRYTHGSPEQLVPGLVLRNPRSFVGSTDSANVTWIHSSPTWTSETRFGLNFNDSNRQDAVHAEGKIPGIEVQGQFSIGGESLKVTGHSYSFEEVIAKTISRHTLKFGGIYLGRAPGRFDEEIPIFRYGSPADFLANRPNRVQFTFGQPRYHGRSWEIGAFIQDDLQLRPNLIVNLGLRYEYFSVFKEKSGLLFNPGAPENAVRVPPVFRPADSIYNSDLLNFLPRVGFAWNIGKEGKTVLRGGFGMTTAPPNLRNFNSMIYINPDVPFRFRFTGSEITSLDLEYPASNEQAVAIITGRPVPRSYSTYDEDNPNPYTMQWTLDIQRQLTSSMVFQTGYVGNKGLKVLMTHGLNLPDRITGVRPFTQALDFTYRDASDFSYYHGWQSSLRKRLSFGLVFDVNYTWSKTMALSQGDFWPGNNFRVQDENNFRADKGMSNLDRTHDFAADVVYELPFNRLMGATGALRQLIGGWQLSGILRSRSGTPLNIVQSSNLDSSRPDYIGGDPYLHTSEPTQYLNRAAFRLVPTSQASGQTIRPGNVGKNSLRALGAWTVDLSLAKQFAISENIKLQFRADAFNAFNNVNLGSPINDLTQSTFGRILSAGEARSMQIGARLIF